MFKLRKAGIEDIPLIRQLTFQVWPQTYASIISQEQIAYMLDKMYAAPVLAQQITDGDAEFCIVENADEPVGFAAYGEMSSQIYKLHKIYILPSEQGKGTGKWLLDKIIDDIRARGATALQLQVNRYNKARDFYEKRGFVVIKEADFDIGAGYFMNDYVMEIKLDH